MKNHYYLMGDFKVKTTGETVFSISKTFDEAYESVVEQERVAKEKNVPCNVYVEKIKDTNGDVKAYVVLDRADKYFVLKFLALNDTEIKVIEFETEQCLKRANREYAIELFDAYERESKRIEENLMSEKERAEFTEAEGWYSSLSFEDKTDVNVLNLASETFGELNGEKLNDAKLRKFCHDKVIAKREAKRKHLTKDETVIGEYNTDGTYNPHTLFNMQFYFTSWVDNKIPAEATIYAVVEFLSKEAFKKKVYNARTYYEKNNITADDVRRYRKRLGLDFVQDIPMTYARDTNSRRKFLDKTWPDAVYDNITYNEHPDLPKESFTLRRCVYCGEYFKEENTEIDHVIPLKAFKGDRKEEAKRALKRLGAEKPNDIENLVCACKACNQKKGASFSLDWILKAKRGSNASYWNAMKWIQNILTVLIFIVTLHFDIATTSNMSFDELMFYGIFFTFEALILVLFALKVPKTDYIVGTPYAFKHFVTSTVFLLILAESFTLYYINSLCLVFFVIDTGLYIIWRFAAMQRNQYLRKTNFFYFLESGALSVLDFIKDLIMLPLWFIKVLLLTPYDIVHGLLQSEEEKKAEREKYSREHNAKIKKEVAKLNEPPKGW